MKIIPLLFLVFLSFKSVQTYAATKKSPNVIVILTDDQGYGDMSCHGNPFIKTPEMDKLYNEGIRLTDFHVDPTCAPTRAALVTGRYSARVGVWLTFASRDHLRRDEITIADIFKQYGYKTAAFGKWHLGENYPFRPNDRGFDESLVHGGGVVGEVSDYWDNNYYDDVYVRNGKPERVNGFCTDVWFNETMNFIDENQDNPFFVYLATNAAHGPNHIPERYRKPFKERAAFFGTISNIDENLGKLRAFLKDKSLERETIIVFLTDNGAAGGVTVKAPDGMDIEDRDGWEVSGYNVGMRGKKSSHYEGGHKAACFFYWPEGGLIGGKDVNGLSAHIDILPTLLDLCNLKFNERSIFDGVSLKDALLNKESMPNRTLIVHDQGRFGGPVGEGLLIKDKEYSVMQRNWRLVDRELYNLSNDFGQRNNIADQHPKVVKLLRKAYESWWESISQNSEALCPFVINPTKQRVVEINSQNLLGGTVAYSQRHVRSGMPVDGWTEIDVEKPGKYKISLRRWPRESQLEIRSSAPDYPMDPSTHVGKVIPSKTFNVVSARLKVGDFDQKVEVGEHDKEISFVVDLNKGIQNIQTWFTIEDGNKMSSYYTYIEPK